MPTNASMASSGLSTIGSPRRLKEVFSNTPRPVSDLELVQKSDKNGSPRAPTTWTLAVPSTCTTAGASRRHLSRDPRDFQHIWIGMPSIVEVVVVSALQHNRRQRPIRLSPFDDPIDPLADRDLHRIGNDAAPAKCPRSDLGGTIEDAD